MCIYMVTLWENNVIMKNQKEKIVVEDTLSRKQELKEWFSEYRENRVKNHQKRYNNLKNLNVPDIIVSHEKEMLLKYSTMTIDEYLKDLEQEANEYFNDLNAQQEFKKSYPPDTEIVEEIFDCFDRWLDADDGYGKMFDFEHSFEEPWFWGEIAPGSNPKYYTRRLSIENGDHIIYGPIFHACSVRFYEKQKTDQRYYRPSYPVDPEETTLDPADTNDIKDDRNEYLKRKLVPIYGKYRESQERGNQIY